MTNWILTQDAGCRGIVRLDQIVSVEEESQRFALRLSLSNGVVVSDSSRSLDDLVDLMVTAACSEDGA